MIKAILLLPLLTFIATQAQTIALQPFASGFTRPLEIANAGDSRLFVVEQGGLIKILQPDGSINPEPFLNISTQISTGSEQGLLGLTFHPNYAANGIFFTNHTNLMGNTVISRYTVDSSNPNRANATSATVLLNIAQPFANHNGGTLQFGLDGYLYIGMGDGGSGGDPGNRAQNPNDLLGKILRIDVDTANPYAIPPSNPFVGRDGLDEIWALGLRNPWKFSFDKIQGRLWIADVGQNNYEEINVSSANQAGINYGWRCYEADTPFNTAACPTPSLLKFPIKSISHSAGFCSISGGYVYNGSSFPNFKGLYFFSDYCNPQIGMLNSEGSLSYSPAFTGNNFSSFGEDNKGELYIAAINNGQIYKIIDSSLETKYFDQSQYAIYPNPAQSQIIIKTSNTFQLIEISLFDLKGNSLYKQKVSNKQNNTIPCDHLSKGMYIVRLKNREQQLASHKILID